MRRSADRRYHDGNFEGKKFEQPQPACGEVARIRPRAVNRGIDYGQVRPVEGWIWWLPRETGPQSLTSGARMVAAVGGTFTPASMSQATARRNARLFAEFGLPVIFQIWMQ